MKKLLLITFLLFSTASLHSQTAEEWVNAGMQKWDHGNNLGAISDFDRAIKLKPDYAWAYYNRGLVNNEIREYKEAVKDFTTSIKYDPDMPGTYIGRGYAYWGLSSLDSALIDLYYYLNNFDKDDVVIRTTIIHILMQQKQYTKAVDEANICLKFNSEYEIPYKLRGDAKLALKDTAAALNDYDRCISLKPDYYDVYLSRGNIFFDLHKYEDAVDDYSTYILGIDYNSTAYFNRGKAKLALQDTNGAINDYTNALKYAKNPAIYFDRGLLYLETNEFTNAVNDFTNAIELEVQDTDLAYFNRGIAYFNLNSIKACDDWHEAGQLGLKEAVDNLAKYCQ